MIIYKQDRLITQPTVAIVKYFDSLISAGSRLRGRVLSEGQASLQSHTLFPGVKFPSVA